MRRQTMAIQATIECDVCEAELLNGIRSSGGRTQLEKLPVALQRQVDSEGWVLHDDRALCKKCQGTIEALGYVRP